MKSKIHLVILLGILVFVSIFVIGQTRNKRPKTSDNSIQQSSERANYKPKDGYVPDEETAIAVAVAVWNPIYGREKIEGEKPFHARLKNGVWTVTGSLPEGLDGGTAEADISKDDGRILRIIHGK